MKMGSDPIKRHIEQLKALKQELAFDEKKDMDAQKRQIKEKLLDLLKIPNKMTDPIPDIEYESADDERFDEIRFCVETEPDFFIPAHLLLPKEKKDKLPLVICLQGHSPGMHVSLAREPYPSKQPIVVEGDRDFCIQAVSRGYAALAIEQRGFGELNTSKVMENGCHELSWQAALMGKTLMGERVRDVISFIDAIEPGFDFIDMTKIGIMGNSGGGTLSYFTACVDERIKVCMPSSSFCTFVEAWGSIYHCACGYIPEILKYMEMPDMAMMIAPRPLVIVNGIHDPIQPFEAAQKAYKTVEKIYDVAGAPTNCSFVVGNEGHRFYAAQSWDIFDKYMGV